MLRFSLPRAYARGLARAPACCNAGMLPNPRWADGAALRVCARRATRSDGTPDSTPNPEHGASSYGLVIDLSRRAQRLLTPWGSLPIGYRLSFPGYQEKQPPQAETDDGGAATKRRPKKGIVPWQLVPAAPATETEPAFFKLAMRPLGAEGTLLVLRKIPLRAHFQVVELLGKPLPKGTVRSSHHNAQKRSFASATLAYTYHFLAEQHSAMALSHGT